MKSTSTISSTGSRYRNWSARRERKRAAKKRMGREERWKRAGTNREASPWGKSRKKRRKKRGRRGRGKSRNRIRNRNSNNYDKKED